MSRVVSSGRCFVNEPVLLDVPAPDFSADAYYRGSQVKVSLSDYKKKWVILFFYSSNFTFV